MQGWFTFRATVYADPTVARREFAAGRDALGPSYTSVASAGEWAYRTLNAGGEMIVEIYDGNLRLRMSWLDAARSETFPVDPFPALMDTCESTMRLLRAN